jgi:hypothetical protein
LFTSQTPREHGNCFLEAFLSIFYMSEGNLT